MMTKFWNQKFLETEFWNWKHHFQVFMYKTKYGWRYTDQEVTKFKIYTNTVRVVHWNSVILACHQLFSHRSTCFWEILPVVTEGSPSKMPPSFHSPFPPWSSFQPSLLWEGLHTLRGVLLRTPWGVLFRDAKFVERNLLSTDLLVVLSWQCCCCSSVHQHQIQNASKLDLFFNPIYQAYLRYWKVLLTLAALPFQRTSLSFDDCTVLTRCPTVRCRFQKWV